MRAQILAKQSSLEPEMVVIPAGGFQMGTNRRALRQSKIAWWDWMARETPAHSLHLPAYAVGRWPVTHAEFIRFAADDGYHWPEFWTKAGWLIKNQQVWAGPRYQINPRWNGDDNPVVGVSWFEAVAYCRWLSRVTGRPFRLLTEAEWEKAARGPDAQTWPWGNQWKPAYCNNWEIRRRQTTPVTYFSPRGDSPFGVADMVGNVWEWCATQILHPYPLDAPRNEWCPEYLAGIEARALRGGSWGCIRNLARCTYRGLREPALRVNDCGFRLAFSI